MFYLEKDKEDVIKKNAWSKNNTRQKPSELVNFKKGVYINDILTS
jgi:hypothetical protein